MPEETKTKPRARLPEKNSEILAAGSKLKFVLNEKGELSILGNRPGLKALAAICSGLSDSTEDDHYRLDEHFWELNPDQFQPWCAAMTNCEMSDARPTK
jgi:hypothetical protein